MPTAIVTRSDDNADYTLAIIFCRAFYILASVSVLLCCTIPFLRLALLPYGKSLVRDPNTHDSVPQAATLSQKARDNDNWALVFLRDSLSVPKSFFSHFYTLGLAWSLWGLWEIALLASHDCPVSTASGHCRGSLASFFVSLPKSHLEFIMDSTYVAPLEVFIASFMMIIQMIRRLYECSFIAKPSSARMHAAHYVVGLLYYLVTPIAVGIEGWSAVEDWGRMESQSILLHITANLCMHHILALLLFVWASVQQYKVHVHLATLRPATPSPGAVSSIPSYNLPRGEWFNYVACPHYLFEVIIYISFGALTRWRNLTCILNIVWVVVDLGVAADQQWKWYKHRFGDKLPKGWKRVVPFIF